MPSATRLRAFALSVAVSAGIGSVPATAGALNSPSSVPKLPTSFETPARGLAVEPKLITISQDGDAFIAGPGAHGYVGGQGNGKPPPIRWKQWTRERAAAAGAVVQGNCTPSCAQGTFTAYRVSISLSRPATSHGQLLFTRMTLRFSGQRPSNYRRTAVLTVNYLAPANGTPPAWGLSAD
jgi:hypothetical protein